MTLLKGAFVCVFGVMQCAYVVRGSKNTLFSTYCTLFCSSLPCLSETRQFLQSSSFWEARHALIGQLSGALWLAEFLKRETEMLRPSPYCDGVSRQDETKTVKPITNKASSWDTITVYNDLYCLFRFVITEATLHCSKPAFESSEVRLSYQSWNCPTL